MEYHHVTKKLPDSHGHYQVKIKTTVGQDRECLAVFNDRGFIPLDDRLLTNEYIYAWAEIDK
jgi:hypothetical protein